VVAIVSFYCSKDYQKIPEALERDAADMVGGQRADYLQKAVKAAFDAIILALMGKKLPIERLKEVDPEVTELVDKVYLGFYEKGGGDRGCAYYGDMVVERGVMEKKP